MKIIITASLLAFSSILTLAAQESKKTRDFNPLSFYPLNQSGTSYATLAAGASFFTDGAVNVNNNNSGADDFHLDPGYALALRAGRTFGPLHLEGELQYAEADITEINSLTGPIPVSSSLTSIGLMGNVLWDFNLKPYTLSVGAGIGFSHLNYDEMINQNNILVSDSSHTVFANQFILGIGYELNENTNLGLNYRYVMMSGFDDRGKVDTNTLDSSDISFDSMGASIVELTLTYKF